MNQNPLKAGKAPNQDEGKSTYRKISEQGVDRP